ncbi:MAG: glutamine amidotransferase [Armatimonadota bacterium]|nr:glutamine amidotransferase [Armatimonadota bacterium]MDR7428387.1 glutamine amidotransferase [Armatimonadota bacterium]MDR7465199.1 glutamine amidotransferase [Armatimonadota bacterium]MDR7469817.1 glutamine amidotransferase [Armatimonadota bacterium]MDR7475970.1 glutamine amidotransferase [Armatimonadota bacterium]
MGVDLRICHLYPDLLNLYGDRGNIAVLVRRARWRGIAVEVTEVPAGTPLRAGAHDLYFIGGGEDRQQALAARDLQAGKGEVLREAVEAGAVLLAVCGGYQLMGHFYRPSEGADLPGVGLLDLTTRHPGKGHPRLIGNTVVRWEPPGAGTPSTLVGFENHGGRTRLGPGVRPLGRVVIGGGNNGEDGTEGAVYRNAFGTYLHGPLLSKNPWFADHLIALALRRRHGEVPLVPLDDDLEAAAHHTALRRTR